MFNKKQNEKGFTMIELIIVVAIMGILAAILAPSFMSMTRKSRMSSDVRTAQNFQGLVTAYLADNNGKYPTATGSVPTDGQEVGAIMASNLVAKEYIEKNAFGSGSVLEMQSLNCKAVWDASDDKVKVSVPAGTKEASARDDMSDKDKAWTK